MNKKIIKFINYLGITISVYGLWFSISLANPPPSAIRCDPHFIPILSIDGGGSKIIIPINLLQKLEEISHVRTANLFDFMTGDSAGSVVVSLLSMPNKTGTGALYSAHQVLELYQREIAQIFSTSLIDKIKTLYGFIGPLFSSTEKKRIFSEVFKDTRMEQLMSYISIPVYDYLHQKPMMLTNWQSNKMVNQFKVSDVINGSTDILSLFSTETLHAADDIKEFSLGDPSFYFLNPAMLSFSMAYNACPSAAHYLILSLGDSKFVGHKEFVTNDSGIVSWILEMLYISGASQAEMADKLLDRVVQILNLKMMDRTNIPYILFVRLNPLIKNQLISGASFSANEEHLLKMISKKFIKENEQVLYCIAMILKNKNYNNAKNCIEILQNYNRQHFKDN